MNALNHIIQKVVLEIDTNSMKVANSLKNNSSAFIQNELLPLIEKELNGLYVNENESIQIEKISVSVDTNASRIDFTFSSEVKSEIQKQLQKKVQEAISSSLLQSEKTEFKTNNAVLLTEKKSNTLIYFLNHGRMPWWNSKSNSINFNDENLLEIVNETDFKLQFRSVISKKQVQERLLNQFNNTQIALFLSSQKGKQNSIALISTNKIIKQLSTESVQFKKKFWIALFNYVSTNQDGNIFSFYDENLQSWSLSYSDFIHELSQFIPVSKVLLTTTSEENLNSSSENKSSSEAEKHESKNNDNQSTNTLNRDLENNINREILGENPIEIQQKNSIENSENHNQNKSKEEPSSIENKTTFKEDASVNNKKKDSASDNNSKDKNAESTEENYCNSELLKKGVYVENAGLILLHPFLKTLFQNCNLLDEKNAIINKEVAVHILHYAATKQEQDYEYTMLFEKFLCGLPLEYPIKREVKIEDYQKNHIEELLTAVVGHWSALKNSSTDILRTEFLQREGKLELLGANPKLTIEKKTQDILLDKIPWNISIVKIPWMEKIIYTEW